MIQESSDKKRRRRIRHLIQDLTEFRYRLLSRLCRFLKMISLRSDINQMNTENIAKIITPNILRSEILNIDQLDEVNLSIHVVSIMINDYEELFKMKCT